MALSKEPLMRAEKAPQTTDVLQRSSRIAAIDFGTSSLSVAYTTPIDGKETKILHLHKMHERVPNAILIKVDQGSQECSVNSLGHQAQTIYSDMSYDEDNKFLYFERIKMLLKRDKSVDRTTTVTSFTGGSYYLIEVIAFIIKHLKEKLLVDQLRGVYKSTDFDWVITVPAIWKVRARRMMREAAYMAGLTSDSAGITKFTPNGIAVPRPEEVNPDKLSLALEPEVAAIYAQHYSSVVGPPPERYMVVDIGGGTVDITVHDNSSGKVSVILPPMGNTWGGTTINEALSLLLEELVQDKGFASFIKSDPTCTKAVLNKLCYEEFEDRKKIFGDVTEDINELVLTLPCEFTQFYGNQKLDDGAIRLKIHFDPGNDELCISNDLIKERIFQSTIDGIVACVRAAFKELTSKINTVYLVGGFGGCKFVRQKIEEAIGEYHGVHYDNIVCPQQPELAVVMGAVMWRKDPTIIQSRVADATYGIGAGLVFDPSKHDKHHRYVDNNGINRCGNIFMVFALKGEVVKDQLYKTTLIPRYSDNAQERIPIYSTTDDGVQYIKDKKGKPTVHKIGDLVLDTPNPHDFPIHKRDIEVFMDLSGTEIQARAQYYITGEEVKTVCDFLSNQDLCQSTVKTKTKK